MGEDDGPVNADRIDDQTYRVRWREFDGPVRYYKVAYRRYSGGQTSRVRNLVNFLKFFPN